MVMKELGGNYLSEEDIVQYGEVWKVLTAPELIESEYKGKKQERYKITVCPKSDREEKRIWTMNPTSSNYLAKTLGKDEGKWVGKDIQIEVKSQVIDGEDTNVLYAKGAISKKK